MSTPVADALRSRRTIHDFEPGTAPPPAVVEAAIAHAVLAPNHYRTRPWRFYLPGPSTIDVICRLNADLVRAVKGDAAADAKWRRWRAIPGWMILACDRSADVLRQREDYAACCCAAQNYMLYLWEQGYGVKWTTGEVTRLPAFLAALGSTPEREEVVGLFWSGRAAGPAPERPPAAPMPIIELP